MPIRFTATSAMLSQLSRFLHPVRRLALCPLASTAAAAAAAAAPARLFTVACRLPHHPLLAVGSPTCRLVAAGLRAASTGHDAKLSSLLDSELRFEKSEMQQRQASQQQRQPQPPEGFTVTARDGTRFTLTKKCKEDGSLLEVSFDLNGSTTSPQDEAGDEEFEEDAGAEGRHQQGQHQHTEDCQHGDEAGEEIQSRPDLVFRVRKPGTQSCLTVRCSFPPAQMSREAANEDPDYPSLSIDTLAVEGEATELGEYELEADMLNDDLYKQLAEMLVHRGVTRAFENSLVEFCTAQEHQLYLKFLAEAKKFCDA